MLAERKYEDRSCNSMKAVSRGTLPIWPRLVIAILLGPILGAAAPIAVRYSEGSVHGFLSLRSLEGNLIAAGDLTQIVRGNHAVSHLVFHFKDGSVDDETAVFTQKGVFRLISDHHIQKGPTFPQSTNLTINASTGEVTVRYQEKGEEKVVTDHLDLPADLANGIILDVIKNIQPDAKESKISYVAASPKPRLVHLVITPQGVETFSAADALNKATCFLMKVDLGGVAGMIVPMIGKQPADTRIWIAGGAAPAFVKSEGPLHLGGPIWRIEMASPVWRERPSH